MTPGVLFWLVVLGSVIAGLAATGAKVLYGFSRRELEVYCRRRQQRELFGEILDHYDEVAVGAETLQIVGIVTLTLSIVFWFFPSGASEPVHLKNLPAVACTSVVLLVMLTLWIPWAVVRVWSAPFLYHTWKIWKVVAWITWPLTVGVKLADSLVRRLAGQSEEEQDEEEAFEDEIRTIVTEGLRDGLLEVDAREMIEGVMELGDADVAEIMTPRSDVDAINAEWAWPEIMALVVEVGRTRLPVYEKTLDTIVGILYVKDLLGSLSQEGHMPKTPLRSVLREPWFVPKTKPVDELLREFRRTRSHMAIVVDEYGAMAGVVTIEDALEEIVGDIVDESDKDEDVDLVQVDQTTLEADGRVHVDELNEMFGLELPENDEFDTLGGFMIHQLGHIPAVGEVVNWEHYRLTVLKANRRRIERVRLEILEEPHNRSA